MPVFLKIPRLVGRLESGLLVSASIQIFSKGNVRGGIMNDENDVKLYETVGGCMKLLQVGCGCVCSKSRLLEARMFASSQNFDNS